MHNSVNEPAASAFLFSDDTRTAIAKAEYWNERELEALCFGVPPKNYGDRDEFASQGERDNFRKKIRDAIKSGALYAERNPSAGNGEVMYGGVWQIAPIHAIRWAIGNFPKFPDWLLNAKLKEIYAMQDDEKRNAGRYTLEEAARKIAESGERSAPMLEKLKAAAASGALPVYGPGESATYQYVNGTTVRTFYEEAYWRDLNKWLEANEPRLDFRFPDPEYQAKYDHAMKLYDERDRLLECVQQDHPYVDVEIKKRLSEIRKEIAESEAGLDGVSLSKAPTKEYKSPPPKTRIEPQGGDSLTPTIWAICYDLQEGGKKVTARPVMAELKRMAAEKTHPLISTTAGGVKYEYEKGDEQELTSQQLDKRIQEWRKVGG